jgi:hypothetical protein
MTKLNRREFFKNLTAGGILATLGPALIYQNKPRAESQRSGFGFSFGLASYTLRAFPLEEAALMTRRLGLEKILLKDIHLPLNSSAAEITAAADVVRAAGLDLYGCGVVYMNNEAEVEQAFSYALTAEMKMIIASPDPYLLPLLELKVKETRLAVAIHNHGPGDKFYPTPDAAYEKVKNLDRRIGLCLDIGHAVRGGIDPARAAAEFSDRLLDVHIKDVSSAGKEGQTVEIGRGVINIPAFLRTLIRLKYTGVLAFEYEKDEKDPLPGLAESVGYVRGILATL